MARILILIFLVFSFSCKKRVDNIEQSVIKNGSINNKADVSVENDSVTCDEVVRKIVFSSNLKSIKNFDDIFIRLEEISDEKIIIKLYIENNLSDNPDEKQIVENAISWLELQPKTNKLYDVTFDPENPVEINFDTKIINKYSLDKICGTKTSKSIIIDNKEVQCESIQGDMMTGEECVFLNSDIKDIYKGIIGKKLITDWKYLLKEIPQQNKSLKINENGLIEINYEISENKVDINLEYEGGVTSIILEKKGKNINRIIIQSAD